MHIGLIGGIGPAATVVYYERLVAAFRDRGAVLNLTIANADVATLARNAAADDRDAQAQVYSRHLHQLQGAGADVAAITSLGGHFCYEQTVGLSPLPLVSAVDPLDAGFARRGLTRVGVLGTRQVMRSAFYGAVRETEILAPEDLDAIHDTYIASATTGTCTPAQRALFFAAGRDLIARGAQAVVLGGTDLGLAFDGHDPGYRVVDALDIHVERLVSLGLD